MLSEIAPNISAGRSGNPIENGDFYLYGSTGIIGKTNNAQYQGEKILIARVGANAGKISYNNETCGITDNTLIVKSAKISARYLYYYLTRYNLNRLIFGSGQPLITGGMLKKIPISFPELIERNKIISFLSLLDERIALQSKLIEDLKKLKSAIVEMLYVQSTSKIRLGAVIKQVSIRNRNGSDRKVMSVNNKYGFIAQSEQFEERLVASEDTSNYKVIVPGIFAYNPARINVGSIAQYNGDKPCVVSPMYICFECEEKVIGAYIEHFFSTKYFHKEMEKRLEGSVRLCLSFEALCNISISLPPKEQQQKYAQVVGRILEQISTETDILQAYQKQKSYLLSAMFI